MGLLRDVWRAFAAKPPHRADGLLPGVQPHSAKHCDTDPACPEHDPTDHHMRAWPVLHRPDGLTVRECPHGVVHPDPDDVRWLRRPADEAGHGCDGCCVSP